MFTKVLFLVVLGCALTYANPTAEADRAKRSPDPAGEKVAAYWHKIEEKIKSFYGKVKDSFVNFWNRITGKESAEKQRRLTELKEKYEELRRQSEESIQAKKAEWNRLVEENERKLKELKQQADSSVENEIQAWDGKFDNLKAEAEQVINS